MAAVLSPFFMGSPSVKTGGAPNVGGFLYTYVAGTTTPLATYTDSTMGVPNANPLTFNSFGLLSTEIWWPAGSSVKFLVTDSGGTPITTLDNVTGLNDNTVTAGTEWVEFGLTPTYDNTSGGTRFTVPGNQTSLFQIGRQLMTVNTAGTVYSTITNSAFGASTLVTVANIGGGALDAGLSTVFYGLLAPTNPSAPTIIGSTTGTTLDYVADYAWMLDSSTGLMTKVLLGTFVGCQYLLTNGSTNTGATTAPLIASGLSASPYSEITICFEGVSLSASGNIFIQLIDSLGAEVTSGYISRCMTINNTTMSSNSSSGGFIIQMGAAAGALYGAVVLKREKAAALPGGDTWHINGSLVNGIGTNGMVNVAGKCNLGSATPALTLDGLRLVSSGGDTFDAGAVWITGRV